MLAAAEGSQAPLVLAPLWPLQGCRVAGGLQGSSPSLITSRCSASWPVWTRRTRMPLVLVVMTHLALYFLPCQVKMLCISASMDRRTVMRLWHMHGWFAGYVAPRAVLFFLLSGQDACISAGMFQKDSYAQWHMHGWFAGYVAPRTVSLTVFRLWLSAVAQLPVPIVICRPGFVALLWRAHRLFRYASRLLVF